MLEELLPPFDFTFGNLLLWSSFNHNEMNLDLDEYELQAPAYDGQTLP